MPFPESPRVVYERTPLVHVLCQLRFPTVLEIGATEAADFQKQIRKSFPLYERRSTLPKEAKQILGDIQLPATAMGHAFIAEDSKREVVLTNEFMTVSDTEYTRWEDFSSVFALAEQALQSVYAPSFFSRIGLRYINLVYRADAGVDNVPWPDLINPALAGITSDTDVGADVADTSSIALLRLGETEADGMVRIRFGYAKEESRPGDFGFLIDSDFHSSAKEGGSNVRSKLRDFNRWAGRLFRWSITERLHEALGPTTIDS
jgi:uncharacterized protein (TIGR04255 family)